MSPIAALLSAVVPVLGILAAFWLIQKSKAETRQAVHDSDNSPVSTWHEEEGDGHY